MSRHLFLLPEVCLLNGTPESRVDPGNIEEQRSRPRSTAPKAT